MTHRDMHDEILLLRVERLERALRRTRRAIVALVGTIALAVLVAWRAADEVRTGKLVLTAAADSSTVVLRALQGQSGPGVILETADGRQILRLGGDPARLVR